MAILTRRGALRSGLMAGASLVSGPFVARARAASPEHTLKLAFGDVTSSPIRPALETFAKAVFAGTDGAVVVRLFGLGELGSQMNAMTGLQTGIIELSAQSTGFIQTVVPQVAVLDLPYVFRASADAERVLDGGAGEQLFKLMEAKGIEGLCWGHWGWRPTSTIDRHLAEPADMQGLKIRVQPGAIFAATYRALGAIPVAIDASEVYVALSQRAIEAIEQPMVTIAAQKLYELVKVVNATNFVYNAGALMASKRKLDQMKPEQRTVIRDAAKALAATWRRAAAENSITAEETLKSKGVTIVKVDVAAYATLTRAVYEQFRSTIGSPLMDLVLKEAGRA